MADLFKKLNVLIRASLNDLLSDESARSRPEINPRRVGKEIDQELTALRERINRALDYETRLQERVKTLEAEVQQLNAEAAEALRSGRQDRARMHEQQALTARRGLEMTRSDLREHQRATQDLIARVNTLEAYAAEIKRRTQHEQYIQDETIERRSQGADESSAAPTSAQAISGRGDSQTARSEDDLDKRRRRLMRPAASDPEAKPPTA
ncbi:MAG: hypothetical protein ACUVS2_12440 [Candidatus Flexifilum sp.]|jgi:phage shock protein A